MSKPPWITQVCIPNLHPCRSFIPPHALVPGACGLLPYGTTTLILQMETHMATRSNPYEWIEAEMLARIIGPKIQETIRRREPSSIAEMIRHMETDYKMAGVTGARMKEWLRGQTACGVRDPRLCSRRSSSPAGRPQWRVLQNHRRKRYHLQLCLPTCA